MRMPKLTGRKMLLSRLFWMLKYLLRNSVILFRKGLMTKSSHLLNNRWIFLSRPGKMVINSAKN